MSTETVEIKKWKRNPETGLLDGVDYKYTHDGRVDWRAMVPKEFLVVNKGNFKNRSLPESIEGLEDKDLLILLGGIKYIASLRGYNSVRHEVNYVSERMVGVKTRILWVPNFETDGRDVEFESLADATTNNTSSFATAYLTATAENRGFVRAVRNFLGINVCGQDEVGSQTHAQNQEAPQNLGQDDAARQLLVSTLDNNGITFDTFQNRMIVLETQKKDFAKGASEWKSISDIDPANLFAIIAFINEGISKKKAKEAKG